MKRVKINLMVGIIFSINLSCRKDIKPEPIVEKEDVLWEEYLSGGELIAVNSGVSDNHLCVSFINSFGTIDLTENTYFTSNYSWYLDNTYQYKIPIHPNITGFIYLDSILYLNEPTEFAFGYSFNLTDFNFPDGYKFQYNEVRKKAYFAISDNQILLPLISNDPLNPQPQLLLLDYTVDNEFTFVPIIDQSTLIPTGIWETTYLPTSLYSIETTGVNFLVSYGTGTFLIRPDNSIEQVLDTWVVDVFVNNDTTWAHLRDEKEMRYSVDHGETWSSSIPLPTLQYTQSNLCFHNHTSINNRIVAYPRCPPLPNETSVIHELIFKDGGFTIKELKCVGLKGDITSVTEFNGYVYVTSLSGVYRKPLEEFFKYVDE